PSGPDAGAGRRLARRPRDRRPLERELLDPAVLEQARLDGVQLGQERDVRTLAEPPLGAEEQLGDPVGARRRPLRPRRRPPRRGCSPSCGLPPPSAKPAWSRSVSAEIATSRAASRSEPTASSVTWATRSRPLSPSG